MNYKRESASPVQKEKARAEIAAHVREYLRRGGKINQVTPEQPLRVKAIGEKWARPFDESLL